MPKIDNFSKESTTLPLSSFPEALWSQNFADPNLPKFENLALNFRFFLIFKQFTLFFLSTWGVLNLFDFSFRLKFLN